MKIVNLFKKNSAKSSKTAVQALNKTQLAKVIGGAETAELFPTTSQRGIEKEKIC